MERWREADAQLKSQCLAVACPTSLGQALLHALPVSSCLLLCGKPLPPSLMHLQAVYSQERSRRIGNEPVVQALL